MVKVLSEGANIGTHEVVGDNMVKEVAAMRRMEEAGVPGVGKVFGWTSDWHYDGTGDARHAIFMKDVGR